MTATLTKPARPAAQISRVPYLPGLDGLRALAVIAVIIYHANKKWLGGGFLGVEVFFVISGYLITLLLVAEHERHGDINLRQFWLRRFRRLLPALFLMMVLLAIYLALVFTEARGRVRGDIVAGAAYVSNWYQIWVGQGYTAAESFVPLRHLWSLAVEEQYYVIWPLVMVAILRSKGRHRLPNVALWLFGMAVLIALAVAVLFHSGDMATTCAESGEGYFTFRGRCLSTNDTLYLSTFSRSTGLLLGGAFAMVWRPLAIMRGPLRHRHRLLDAVGLLGVALTAFLCWKLWLSDDGRRFGVRFDPWLFRGGFFVVGVATLMMIAAVTHRRSTLGKMLAFPALNWVGTRSYGLYLYHWPIFQIIRKRAGGALTFTELVMAMTLACVLTEVSYRLVETPIRKGAFGDWLRGERPVRSRSAPPRRGTLIGAMSAALLVGFASLSIARAENRCVNDVECSIEAASNPELPNFGVLPPPGTAPSATGLPTQSTQVPGSIGATTGGTPTSVGSASPPTLVPIETSPSPPASTALPTTTQPPPSTPIAIGESVMQGAQPELQTAGFWVDTAVSRGGNGTLEALTRLKQAGWVGDTVVIQVGTNGEVSNEQFDAIMALLPPPTKVYFLTVRAPKAWIAGNNERINALPSRFPNVQIIDWQGASQDIKMCDDGIHISCGSARAYANVVFNGIGRADLVR
jgi:peptidoglycan/LPS O-acetylase OafA/YrhL